MLANDEGLRDLHAQLVSTGLLSEQEFWAQRKSMLESEMLRYFQLASIQSVLFWLATASQC